MKKELVLETKKIKTMMSYDTSKTFFENKIINEQNTECPNAMSLIDLQDRIDGLGNALRKMDMAFVRMGYGKERAKEIYDSVNYMLTKNVWDDVEKTCQNALSYCINNFREFDKGGRFLPDFISSPKELDVTIKNLIDGFYKNDASVLHYLKPTYEIIIRNKSKGVESATSDSSNLASTDASSQKKKGWVDTDGDGEVDTWIK